MKYVFFILMFSFWGGIIIGQNDDPVVVQDPTANNYPEGIYLDYESFLSMTPSTTKRVEARNLLKPKKRINDPLIDNCYFYYRRTKKRVKDAFAISYKGSLYIHIKSMKKHMDKKDKKQKIDYQDSFIRVVDQGEYLYLEGYFRKGGGLGLAIGGGPISVGTGGPKEKLKGIVFDFERDVFDIIRDCKDFNNFLQLRHRERTFKCSKKSIPLTLVRKVIFDINRAS